MDLWLVVFSWNFQLGEAMADTLLEMFSEGLNVEKFHLVGHSLGGQLAGYIGRTVLARTKGGVRIKR
jgi:pimeloyl-ACP methyl ester carboxylesterase